MLSVIYAERHDAECRDADTIVSDIFTWYTKLYKLLNFEWYNIIFLINVRSYIYFIIFNGNINDGKKFHINTSMNMKKAHYK